MGRRGRKTWSFNLKSTPEALPQFIAEKNVDLFLKHHIFTKEEIHSRYEILLENYERPSSWSPKPCRKCSAKTSCLLYPASQERFPRAFWTRKHSCPPSKQRKELALVESLTAAYETLSEGNDKLKASQRRFLPWTMQEAATFCH